MGIEVIDCLLDNGIAQSVEEALVIGQELLFSRKLLPVHLCAESDVTESNNSNDSSSHNVKSLPIVAKRNATSIVKLNAKVSQSRTGVGHCAQEVLQRLPAFKQFKCAKHSECAEYR